MLQPRNPQHSFTKTTMVSSNQPTLINKTFIGLTLKEYFNIGQCKRQLDEIDEENNSQISGGTPCFGGQVDQQKDRIYRRNRHKTELQQLTLENEKINSNPKPTHRMVTLSLDQLTNIQRNSIKLPSIHQQRPNNMSRKGLKQTKQLRPDKRETQKQKKGEPTSINLVSFLKRQENGKHLNNNANKNVMNMRRGLRSRVTSTSFYHMNLRDRQRERIRTQEQIDTGFEKSFIITRYGGMMSHGKNKEQQINLKKYENSFKLTKN